MVIEYKEKLEGRRTIGDDDRKQSRAYLAETINIKKTKKTKKYKQKKL